MGVVHDQCLDKSVKTNIRVEDVKLFEEEK